MDALQPDDPQWVGRYRLLRRLGAGGMGRVFLGQSPGGRLVAVKLIRPELADDPGFRRRFAQEVSAARLVSGIFTAPVVDADPEGPQPWLVTAYVAGPSLADAVEAQGPMPVESVLTLAAGLAEGLGAVHAAGMVHRDLKPSNVLLASDGPRIIDFGISRATDSAWLTNVGGVVVGSPGFMSPEQAEGRRVGPASDIFSLGGVLAYAATGQAPFGAGAASALLYRVVYGTAATGHVPAPLRRLVERCLAKDPADRPSTDELLAELGYAEPGEDWLTWSAAGQPAATELAATQLDQAARWDADDHDHNNGNGVVLAGSIPLQRGPGTGDDLAGSIPLQRGPAAGDDLAGSVPLQRGPGTGDDLADDSPADGNAVARDPVGRNPADRRPADGPSADGPSAAGRHRAHRHQPGGKPARIFPVAVTEQVTAPRHSRHTPSSALIGAAVAFVLAAGTAGAVAYVVASDQDQLSSQAGVVAPRAQIRADNRSQQDHAGGRQAESTPPGPRAIVDSYFEAIDHHDWPQVWRLGGENPSPSYQAVVDGYASTDQDVVRAISVSGDQAIVRVRAYQTDGAYQVYQMDFVIQNGVIVHATQQLLTAVPAARVTRPDGRA
jgi:hypothetical protein